MIGPDGAGQEHWYRDQTDKNGCHPETIFADHGERQTHNGQSGQRYDT